MRLFLLPSSFNNQNSIKLEGKDFNYIVKVLRMKEGQTIMGRDRDGGLWNLTIKTIEKNYCILCTQPSETLEEHTDALPEDRPLKPIILYQCLPKGRKL
ncbi:MAG: 16S rRNA (uracil(1498)-N(3))-methyltransferase, partial [Sphaerochaetaceae bacterium]|nr:16S rRNA (uracil(1498)-N(3))-methyltransferase [Sphaerochaetaceae bacterium]